MLLQKEKLECDIESYKYHILDISPAPLLNLFEFVQENKKTPEDSIFARYNYPIKTETLNKYYNSRLGLKDVTPIKDMVNDMETIAFIYLISEEELCIKSKNFCIPDQPVKEAFHLPFNRVTRKVEKTSYWVQKTQPYYIGTFEGITRLFYSLSESAKVIIIPNNLDVNAYLGFDTQVEFSNKVVKAHSNKIGLLKTYPGESPDQNALPWMRVGPEPCPPSPPLRTTQCGACYKIVPNTEAFEVLDV